MGMGSVYGFAYQQAQMFAKLQVAFAPIVQDATRRHAEMQRILAPIAQIATQRFAETQRILAPFTREYADQYTAAQRELDRLAPGLRDRLMALEKHRCEKEKIRGKVIRSFRRDKDSPMTGWELP